MKIKELVISALLLFYILCWLTDQPTKLLWWLGVALPWLSLFATIPILFLTDTKESNNGKIWAYIYALFTIIYYFVVSNISGFWGQNTTYIASCVTFILYFYFENQQKKK